MNSGKAKYFIRGLLKISDLNDDEWYFGQWVEEPLEMDITHKKIIRANIRGRGVYINTLERYIYVGAFRDGLKRGSGFYQVAIGNAHKLALVARSWDKNILKDDDAKEM